MKRSMAGRDAVDMIEAEGLYFFSLKGFFSGEIHSSD